MCDKFFASEETEQNNTSETKIEVNNKLFEIIEMLYELINGSDLEKLCNQSSRSSRRIMDLMETQANALVAQKELLECASVRCDNTNAALDLEALKLNQQAMKYNMEILMTQNFQDLSGFSAKKILSELRMLFNNLLLMNEKLGNEPVAIIEARSKEDQEKHPE